MSVTFFILIWHLGNPQTLTEKLKQLIIGSPNIAVNMRSEYTAVRPTSYHLYTIALNLHEGCPRYRINSILLQKFAGLVIT